MRWTVGIAVALLSLAGFAPVAAAPSDDLLEQGDTISSGKVEFTVVKVGQLHAVLRNLTVHTEAAEPITDAQACVRSDYRFDVRTCDHVVVAHDGHYDIRIRVGSHGYTGTYDKTTVRYHYTDADSGSLVSGRKVLTFPVNRLQSPPRSILYLYPKGEGLYDGPGTVCKGDFLKLEGSLYTWDTNIGADADFHGAPFMVQFRSVDTEEWSTIRTEPLDGTRDSRPSWGHVQPRGQGSLLLRARETGYWRLHWPGQIIDGYSFSPMDYPLGYSRVTRCV